MAEPARPGRKRLLVAAVGVATASFLGKQGCSSPPRYETFSSGNLVPPPHEAGASAASEGDAGPDGASSAQAQDGDRAGSADAAR
jgi:hypothetical protein